MRKVPSSVEIASRVTPVPEFVIFTVAPATTAPFGSKTLPTKNPLLVCPKTLLVRASVTRAIAASTDLLLITTIKLLGLSITFRETFVGATVRGCPSSDKTSFVRSASLVTKHRRGLLDRFSSTTQQVT